MNPQEKCDRCGKWYLTKRNIAGRNKHSYCSENCRVGIYRNIEMRKNIMDGKVADTVTIGKIKSLGFDVIINKRNEDVG